MQNRKLILVNPLGKRHSGLALDKTGRHPPLSLAIIAALCPDNWEIVLKDENFEAFEFEEGDLVGITSFTSSATRAYEIAELYKEKKIPVVMGGVHASMLIDEALNYVDTVVVGEAESVWADLLDDFEKGQMKRVYTGERLSLDKIPIARHDIFSEDYLFDSIQTTRGCPMNCEFCSVTVFNGNAYRMRPVEDVLEELETIKANSFMFIDDNIVGYNRKSKEHAKSLFRGMIERGIKKDWMCQATINFADDDELLELAAKSGCRMVFIGVESENTKALEKIKKRSNLKVGVDNYPKVFNKIQSYGISVLGAFIFGLETDTMEDLKARINYIKESNIDALQISFLTPVPGTDLYEKFTEDGRIFKDNYPEDWEYYDGFEIVMHPAKVTVKQFEEIKLEIAREIYDYDRLVKRLSNTIKATKNPKSAAWAFSANSHYHNILCENDKSKHIGVMSLLTALNGNEKNN